MKIKRIESLDSESPCSTLFRQVRFNHIGVAHCKHGESGRFIKKSQRALPDPFGALDIAIYL